MKKKLKLARKLLSIALVMTVAFTFSFVSPKLADSTAYADETITFATNGVGDVSNGYKVEVKGASASNGMYVVEFTGKSFTVPTESESVGGKFGAVDTTTKSVQYTVKTDATAEQINTDLSAITYVGSGSISITAVKQAPKSGNVYYNGNGHYYKLITEKKTWWEAMKDSMNASSDYTGYKAHPLTITSPGEMDVVKNLCGSNKIWLGAVPSGNTGESDISGDNLPKNKSTGNVAGKGSNWIWIWNTPEAGATLPDDPTDLSGKTVCTYWHGGEPSGGTTSGTTTQSDTYVLCMSQSGENVLWDDLDKTVVTSWDDYKTMYYIIEYSPYDTEGSKWAGDKNNTNAVKAMSDTYSSANVKEDAGVTITSAPASKTYGDADFTVTASKTVADGGKWTWTSSNPQVLKIVSGGNAETATVQVLKADATGATLTAKYESNTHLGTATTAAITVAPKTLSTTDLTHTGSVSKTYDGNTDAPANLAIAVKSTSKVKNNDVITLTGGWTYDNANAGSNKTLTYTTSSAVDGNYSLASGTTYTIEGASITKTMVSGKPAFKSVSTSGQTLASVTPDNFNNMEPTGGTFAWTLDDTTEVVQGTAYAWTYTLTGENEGNYEVLKGSYTPWAKSSYSGGGGGSASTVQKPVINNGDNGTYTLSADGTTATFTPNAGYEIDKATVNGNVVTPKDGKLTGLKTGDNVKVTYKKADSTIDQTTSIKDKVAALELMARSSKTSKKNIKVVLKMSAEAQATIDEIQSLGYTVKYKFYRSTKKSASYKAALTKTSKTYLNTVGTKGTMYYYKARVQVYDVNGNLVTQTGLKQCKYANRQWTK